jgi:molecular chaperone GrpE
MERMDRIDRPDRPERRTRAQQRAAEINLSPAQLATQIQRLIAERDGARKAARAEAKAEIETAAKERDDYLAALQRERAEFQNFRRRTAEERQANLGLAGEDLIRKVLALADDFDRAVETRPATIADDPWVEGIAAIDRKLRLLLESEGVTEIEAERGTPFDPRDHEAVATVPAPGVGAGEIVEELRRGYRLRERVIRPALVAVAEGEADDPIDEDAPLTIDKPIH